MAGERPRRDPERQPVHPGAILREDVLPDLGLSVSAAAERLGVSRHALTRLLSGSAAVSPAMALRLGRFCGNGPEVWMRLQAAYDLWHAERALGAELDKIARPAA